jgi:hypothetical protein
LYGTALVLEEFGTAIAHGGAGVVVTPRPSRCLIKYAAIAIAIVDRAQLTRCLICTLRSPAHRHANDLPPGFDRCNTHTSRLTAFAAEIAQRSNPFHNVAHKRFG